MHQHQDERHNRTDRIVGICHHIFDISIAQTQSGLGKNEATISLEIEDQILYFQCSLYQCK